MRRFSLYRRGRIWYAQLYNPKTRRYTSGRSTGESSRNEASLVVAGWLFDGIPKPWSNKRRAVEETFDVDTILTGIRSAALNSTDTERIVSALKDRELLETAVVKGSQGSEDLVAFLERFWTFDSSPYVREKLAHGHRMGRRHCYDMSMWTRVYWKPFFAGRKLGNLSKADLKSFSLWLAESKNLKPKTINNVLAAGTVALRWAAENEFIGANPAAGLVKFSGTAAKRGVLTEQEVQRLFAQPWAEERAWLGNILAMSTGLRAGEVLAVQIRDIDADRLHVRHSWSNLDGLKAPKTGEERDVPLIGSVREALLALAKKNPQGVGPMTFVFWSSTQADRPMDFHFLLDPLKDALLKLRLNEKDLKEPGKVQRAREYWTARAVVFHSWRHYFAARMADQVEARKAMLATGHRDKVVFDAYADHSTEKIFGEVRAIAAETFGRLLPFGGKRKDTA